MSGDVVRNSLSAHMDAVAAVMETQCDALVAAAARLARCLLDESRIFVCGNAGSAANAQHFSVKLLGRLERERPGLPVFCLAENAALLTSLAEHYGASDVYARQIRALGQPGDVLVALAATGIPASTMQVITAAHDRDMSVVVLGGRDREDLAHLLTENDIEILVPASSPTRVEEIHLLLIHVLCDLLERELFGDLP